MEITLENKKEKILKRLENTIESVNSILYEINNALENIIDDNLILETTAEIHDTWVSKE